MRGNRGVRRPLAYLVCATIWMKSEWANPREVAAEVESRVLVVPTIYSDVKTAVRQLRNGDRVYVRSVPQTFRSWEGGEPGWNSWQGRCWVTNEPLWRSRKVVFPYSGAKSVEELHALYEEMEEKGEDLFKLDITDVKGVGSISILGDPFVKLSGQIIFCDNTTGTVEGPMTMALFSDINPALEQFELRYVSYFKACLEVHGRNWTLDRCRVQSSGGVALRAARRGSVRARGCRVGGAAALDADGRRCAAACAVAAADAAECVMVGCRIRWTEVHKRQYRGGYAIKVSGGGCISVEDSDISQHQGVVVYFDDSDDFGVFQRSSARVSLRDCVIATPGVCFFAVRGRHAAAQLDVRDSTLYGDQVWANRLRPGSVIWGGNRLEPSDGIVPPSPECFRSAFTYLSPRPPRPPKTRSRASPAPASAPAPAPGIGHVGSEGEASVGGGGCSSDSAAGRADEEAKEERAAELREWLQAPSSSELDNDYATEAATAAASAREAKEVAPGAAAATGGAGGAEEARRQLEARKAVGMQRLMRLLQTSEANADRRQQQDGPSRAGGD